MPLAFRGLQIDGAAIDAEVKQTNAGLRLHLPERIAAAERVELGFAATVFQNNTRFRAFLERESGLDTLRQQVDSGDAIPDLAGAGDAVSLPVDGSLLTRLDMGAGIFTPNGDGVNDALAISFDVLKVIDARPIEARVYDLRGQLVRTLRDDAGVAGHYQLTWDGRRGLRCAGPARPLPLALAGRWRLRHPHLGPQHRPELLRGPCGAVREPPLHA